MINILISGIIITIIAGATIYIIRQKKKGVKCIGCPMASQCATKKKGNCSSI